MSLKLKRHENVPSGLQRIIAERLQIAISELERAGPQSDEAIHNARKRLKESRASLRLLRPAVPDDVYRSEKTTYRDVARPLSQVRDARVSLDALNSLACPAEGERIDVPAIRNELEARRAHLHQELMSDGLMERLGDSLAQAVARIHNWPVEPGEWKTLRRGLRPIYRRGRRLMQRIAKLANRAAPPDEILHEWRKQAKALWYQVEVLEHVWPEAMKPLATQVHQLTNFLGEDHDLAVLRELIEANGASGLPPKDRALLLERIDGRRGELQNEALEVGTRIYAERAKAFTRRLKQYWRTWKTEPAKQRSITTPCEEGAPPESMSVCV